MTEDALKQNSGFFCKICKGGENCTLHIQSLGEKTSTTDDDQLHGSGRRVENASEGVTMQITKTTDSAGILNIYLYVLMDAQLNIEDGRFVSALY